MGMLVIPLGSGSSSWAPLHEEWRKSSRKPTSSTQRWRNYQCWALLWYAKVATNSAGPKW